LIDAVLVERPHRLVVDGAAADHIELAEGVDAAAPHAEPIAALLSLRGYTLRGCTADGTRDFALRFFSAIGRDGDSTTTGGSGVTSSAVDVAARCDRRLLRIRRAGDSNAQRGARKHHVRKLEHRNTPQNAIKSSRYIFWNIALNKKMLMPPVEAGPSVAIRRHRLFTPIS
jgi:hypothetical protein